MHIAAASGNHKVLEYLAKNVEIDIWDRNDKGMTPLNICETLKNEDSIKLLREIGAEYDKSKDAVNDLYDELMAEEEKAKEDRAKKAEKRKRNKVNRLAKTQNITAEEAAEELRLAAEKRAKEEEL